MLALFTILLQLIKSDAGCTVLFDGSLDNKNDTSGTCLGTYFFKSIQSIGSTLNYKDVQNIVVDGCTFQNGNSHYIEIVSGQSLKVLSSTLNAGSTNINTKFIKMADPSSVSITETKFNQDSSQVSSSSIEVTGLKVPISFIGCKFNDLKNAEDSGSGIIISCDTLSKATFSLCGFVSTISSKNGGAVAQNNDKLELEFLSCNFQRCSGTNGGALYITNKASITKCTFDENGGSSGRFIYATESSDYFIDNCTFKNVKEVTGDNLHLLVGQNKNTSGFRMTNCVFKNMSHEEKMGAVGWYIEINSFNKFELINCMFEECVKPGEDSMGKKNGGVFQVPSNIRNVFIYNCIFIKCKTLGKDGGALAIGYNTDANISRSSFMDCSAKDGQTSGSLYFFNTMSSASHTIILDSCQFYSKNSKNGFILLNGINFFITNCIFEAIESTSNYVMQIGLYDKEVPFNINNSIFRNCTNGIKFYMSTNFKAKEVNFNGCTFESSGSTNNVKNNGRTNFENCIFDRCKGSNGAALYLDSNDTIVKNCNFINCEADNGAIYVSDSVNSFTMEDSNFYSCTAREKGGALYLAKGVAIKNCSFDSGSKSPNGQVYLNLKQGDEVDLSKYIFDIKEGVHISAEGTGKIKFTEKSCFSLDESKANNIGSGITVESTSDYDCHLPIPPPPYSTPAPPTPEPQTPAPPTPKPQTPVPPISQVPQPSEGPVDPDSGKDGGKKGNAAVIGGAIGGVIAVIVIVVIVIVVIKCRRPNEESEYVGNLSFTV